MLTPPLTVREVAEDLGVSPKSMRAWMRQQNWRSHIEQGQPWTLTADQVAQLRDRFGEQREPAVVAATAHVSIDPLPDLTVAEVLTNYRNVLASLRSRGLVRTNNAPIGDLAEYCAAIVYDGLLAPNSEKSYDLVSADERRIQVKVRLIRPGTARSAVFSPIRSFDFEAALFLLISDENGEVELARELSTAEVREHGRHREHTNGTVVRIAQIRTLSAGTDLTGQCREAWQEMLSRRG